MSGSGESSPGSSAILTVPNVLSFLRIALIPVFCVLIVGEESTKAGIALFGAVVATDWVDGSIARRTGQVSELGKILDPVADRLAIGAGLIALMIRGAFPVWAGVAILIRDAAVLVGGAVLLLGTRRARLDVTFLGKVATFSLMTAVPAISWGTLGFAFADAALVVGWVAFAVGIVEYYVAAAAYLADLGAARPGP